MLQINCNIEMEKFIEVILLFSIRVVSVGQLPFFVLLG